MSQSDYRIRVRDGLHQLSPKSEVGGTSYVYESKCQNVEGCQVSTGSAAAERVIGNRRIELIRKGDPF